MNHAPLRAFLMLRSSQGDWSVSVCRDLAEVIQAWKARAEPDVTCGVLHVGFDRPPSRTFEDLGRSNSGRVLLTASAKYALPSTYHSSKQPIGFAENLAVYIATQGWGYDLEDPTLHEPTAPVALKEDAKELAGWVAVFAAENPAAKDDLSKYEIFDDETYLQHEAELPRSLKHKIGEYRVSVLVRQDCDDPCEIAKACPPWLLERELVSLDLSVRASNVFKVCNINTVLDLSEWTPERLLEQQNFGRKSLRDAVFALRAALAEGPVGVLNGQDLSNSGRLLDEVRRSILSFSERERDVVSRRLGFECSPQTLQEVADDYNLTRERIRQIESKTIRRWIRESFWDDVLLHKLARLVMGRAAPLPAAGIEGADAWFEGVGQNLVFFKNLVQVACGDRINVIEVHGLHYLTMLTQASWETTVTAAEQLLSAGVGQQWSEAYARSLVAGLLPDNAKEMSDLLWEEAAKLCHFGTNVDGTRTLISFGRGAEQIVEAVLAEAESPLHYSEIAEKVRAKSGRPIEIRRAHSAAAAVGFLFGPGTYGLAHHIPLSEEQMTEIRAEAEEIIISDTPGRQWHCYELLRVLLDRIDESYIGLDKYILNITLLASQSIRSLRRMTWVAKEATDVGHSRIDIQHAILSFVKSASRPVTADEIRQNLSELRGVNETFAITGDDQLIRIGAGLWGINDRDLALTRSEQRILIDMLVEHLEETQRGLYGDEISELLELKGCPISTFMMIAHQDERIKVSVSRCLYLSKWSDARREPIGRSVEAILKESDKPLPIDAIVILTSQRIGRKCSRAQVSAALQAVEAIYDDTNRVWSYSPNVGIGVDDNDELDVGADTESFPHPSNHSISATSP